ncbi:acetyl-CoA carboxylase carboxyltransferase subunit beta [Candidatus Sumerlaeota bacterium]|nr:acetyl-CoA carboxylase carboxyltransferase subunit beta [Candidatus Sumerlaeota bacterium]
MPWFEKKPKFSSLPGAVRPSNVPEGLYEKCPDCYSMIYRKEFEENLHVCPKCHYHARVSARERIVMLVDPGTFQEDNSHLSPVDKLQFEAKKKYSKQIEEGRKKTGQLDAIVSGIGKIHGKTASLAIMDFTFLGGSMGSVVGEKVTRAMERALAERIPVITVTATGGARMMESILSLMQMAKTSALCAELDRAGIPFISVLSDPSTAGVMASFAALGDVIIAEPRCLVGFAGRRVIEQTVREHLPKGFQTAEFVQEHGFVDIVCERRELRGVLARLLNHLWYASPKRKSDGNGRSRAGSERSSKKTQAVEQAVAQ